MPYQHIANGRLNPSQIHRAAVRTLVLVATAVLLAAVMSLDVYGQKNTGSPAGPGTTTPLNPDKPVTYAQVLVYGLLARTPTELQFIASVVEAVNEGKLPARLVDQTFFWARERSGNNLYGRAQRPIVYFIPALEARVKRLRLPVEFEGGLP